ncbi:helix-turn-helix domain-containing protein [Clostridium frigoris]|uniref:helix-turn-helix domain-containing protein n=1 Tax=Clostridium frigoris TaxID=205327 RepID=UPI001FE3E130|nr:helix-turn-helix domain-containing protein [Clostridium frigoris]
MKTIRQCLIDFLLYESFSQNNLIIKLELTKKELAEKFGIQRPSLSRELNKMRMDGLIEYDAHSITIINYESLTSI